MKNKFALLGTVLTFAALGLAVGGCVSSHKSSGTVHEKKGKLTGGTIDTNGFVTVTTNGAYKFKERWADGSHGGATAVLTDSSASQISSTHTNQTALGGGSGFAVGNIQSKTSTNAADVIAAGGKAAGDLLQSIIEASKGVKTVTPTAEGK